MSKTELTEYKKQLKDKDCMALVKLLIPPREPKSKCAKKPAPEKKPATKAKQTIAGAALESLPPGIAKQVAQMKIFMKWANAAGSKPLNTRP
eukprot:7376780-Prymnesium_polylepis.1